MVLDIQTVAGIAGSALLLALGYFINGHYQRRLERQKTNYHAKLEAFQEMNRGTVGLFWALARLRSLLSLRWDKSEPQDLLEVISIFTETHEIEAPLRTNVTQRIADDLKDVSLIEDEEKREEALRDWAEAARVSLFFLLYRAVSYHISELIRHAANADLVAEYDQVSEAIGKLQGRVFGQLMSWAERFGGEPPSARELLEEFSALEAEWGVLREVMWEELAATLR